MGVLYGIHCLNPAERASLAYMHLDTAELHTWHLRTPLYGESLHSRHAIYRSRSFFGKSRIHAGCASPGTRDSTTHLAKVVAGIRHSSTKPFHPIGSSLDFYRQLDILYPRRRAHSPRSLGRSDWSVLAKEASIGRRKNLRFFRLLFLPKPAIVLLCPNLADANIHPSPKLLNKWYTN